MSHYVLPKLPYAYDALEPLIDAETMKVKVYRQNDAGGPGEMLAEVELKRAK